MNVLLLTIFLSTILAVLFIFFFISDRASSRHSSPEQDSLLPLADEDTVPEKRPKSKAP